MREWLVYLRKQKNLKLKDVSAATGVSVTALSSYETGDRRPRVDKAKKLAEFLGFEWTRFYE